MRTTVQRLVLLALASVALLLAAGCGSEEESSTSTSGGSSSTSASTTAKAEVPEVPFESPERGLPTSYPEARPADLTIGLLNPRRASESVAAKYDAAKERIRELGGRAIELDAGQNPDKQISQFEQLINQRVDAIGIVPIADPKLLRPLLIRAERAGIPVIGIEVTPGRAEPVPGFASQVWQAHDRKSYLQAQAAAELLGPGAKMGQVGFALPVPLFTYSEERLRHWARAFGLDIVDVVEAEQDSIDSGNEAAAGLVAKHPDLQGIFGFTDEAAIGAALAARAAGRNDIKTFGVLAGPVGRNAIRGGRLTASIYEDGVQVGRTFADGLYAAGEGIRVPPVVVASEPIIVTEENVEEIEE